MRDQTINQFLGELAAKVPAPGGGASAGLHAAQAAALLAMVARYSEGPKYAEHADTIARVLAEADMLRDKGVDLMEQDANAFTAVTDAYRLPKDTDEQKSARSAAIADALIGAAQPPAAVIVVAEQVVGLAEQLLPVGNRNVITDVAAAVEAARAAATTARVNVEINLGGIKDAAVKAELSSVADRVGEIATRAEQITSAVRKEISR